MSCVSCSSSSVAARTPKEPPTLQDLARSAYPNAQGRYVSGTFELTLKSSCFGSTVVSFPHEVIQEVRNSAYHMQQKIRRVFAAHCCELIPKDDYRGTLGIVSRIREIVQSSPRRDIKEVIAKLGDNTASINTKKTVFFIGPSQVGKTTTVNRLLGFPCAFLDNEKLCLTGTEKTLVIQPKKDANGGLIYPEARIGIGESSETDWAAIYSSQEETISYCDCPGAEDSRADKGRSEASQQQAQLDLTNIISVRELLDITKEVQGFAVFVEFGSLFVNTKSTDTGKKFNSAVLYLEGLFCHNLEPFKKNLWIVITKIEPPQTPWSSSPSNQAVCAQMSHWLKLWQDWTSDRSLKKFYAELDEWIGLYPDRIFMYNVESDRDTKKLKEIFSNASPLETKTFGYPLSAHARAQVTAVGQAARDAISDLIKEKVDKKIKEEKEKILTGSIEDRISNLKILKDTLAISLIPNAKITDILGVDLTQDRIWTSNEPMWKRTQELDPSLPNPFSKCLEELRSRLKMLILICETELYSNRELLRDQSFDQFLNHCNIPVEETEKLCIQTLIDRAKDRLKLRDFLLDEKNTKKLNEILNRSSLKSFNVHSASKSQLSDFVGMVFKDTSLITNITEWDDDEIGFLRQLLDQNLINPLKVSVSSSQLKITSLAERVCMSTLNSKVSEQNLNTISEIYLQVTHPEGQGVLYFDTDFHINANNIALFITADILHIASKTQRKISTSDCKWPPNRVFITTRKNVSDGGTYYIE